MIIRCLPPRGESDEEECVALQLGAVDRLVLRHHGDPHRQNVLMQSEPHMTLLDVEIAEGHSLPSGDRS